MPLETQTLVAFALASLIVYATPGVDMAYIASQSLGHGRRAGLWAACGTVLGVSLQAGAAAIGVTALFAASPLVFEILRWAGVAYLAWLGAKILLSQDSAPEAAAGSPWTPTKNVVKGATINLLNPKVALFFVAFLPQFVDPAEGRIMRQLGTLGGLFAIGSALWCALLAIVFARVGDRIRRTRGFLTWQRRITGTAFLAFAGLLAVADLRR